MSDRLIRLPWPPAKTSPNKSGQGNWHEKASAARSYKQQCAWECVAQGIQPMALDAVTVRVTFHPPRNGRFDLDNALARAKQGLDAVAEAIGVDDGEWAEMRLTRGHKVKGGCVLVHVRPTADNWQHIGDIAASMVRGVVK